VLLLPPLWLGAWPPAGAGAARWGRRLQPWLPLLLLLLGALAARQQGVEAVRPSACCTI
jgi:hypothetical protein